jgi:hypothetical protein
MPVPLHVPVGSSVDREDGGQPPGDNNTLQRLSAWATIETSGAGRTMTAPVGVMVLWVNPTWTVSAGNEQIDVGFSY